MNVKIKDMTPEQRQQYNREMTARHRAKYGKPRVKSYARMADELREVVTRLEICLAWESGELTEGQAAKMLGVDRLEARAIKGEATARGAGWQSWQEMCRAHSSRPSVTGYMGDVGNSGGGDPDTV